MWSLLRSPNLSGSPKLGLQMCMRHCCKWSFEYFLMASAADMHAWLLYSKLFVQPSEWDRPAQDLQNSVCMQGKYHGFHAEC